ncbi:hypothetical protein NEMBOFW57_000432 [Staphylotrichum longicolle]|uniref:Uncharacterized protein n=1 Tax=Staphylotrichum longicolle TaxID=669026 RepID=A0AAD4I0W8_9PEZI|nr:hypothetical protein NEMBOFW57_000432 [Staphylotrichum longicolle]
MSSEKETHQSLNPNDAPTIPSPSSSSKHLALEHHQQASSTALATPPAPAQPTQLPIRSAMNEMSNPTDQTHNTAVLKQSSSSSLKPRPRPYPDPNPASPPDIESDPDSDSESSEEEWNGFNDEDEIEADGTSDAARTHAHAHPPFNINDDTDPPQHPPNASDFDRDSNPDSDATLTESTPTTNAPNTDTARAAAASLQTLNALRDEILQLRIQAAETKRREALDALNALTVVNANLSDELQRLLGLEALRGMDREARRRALAEASAVRILAPEEWHMLVVDTTGWVLVLVDLK